MCSLYKYSGGNIIMASFVSNLIDYTGITDPLPTHPHAFKQFSVQENVCLPEAKPDIEQITKVMAEVVILKTRVIATPGSQTTTVTSQEGQTLTGWKVIVEGEVQQKVEYVADEPTQSVHAAHFNVPFSTFVVLPNNYTPGTTPVVTGYIEDIFAHQLNKRCIFKNITILVTAE
jgi:hypothetical protein